MIKRLGLVSLGLLVLIALLFGGWELSRSRTLQVFGNLTHRVTTAEKVVALTFDDGPTNRTEDVLRILEELNVKATFFVTGNELENSMDAGRKIVAAGHELGNHSFSHRRMVLVSPGFVRDEVGRTDALIRQAGYEGDIHFRPPNGKKFVVLPWVLRQLGKKTIMWDVEPETYPEVAASSAGITEYVLESVRPGSIVLLHVMYPSRQITVEALSGIVHGLREQGYAFYTVSEILEFGRR